MANAIKKRTACSRDCPDACGIIATVEDGIITRLQGDPDHPVTKGFLCHRTSRFLERQYSPDRLQQPLIRGSDGFEPIDWTAALDLVAEKMIQFRRESGAASILNYRCGGSLGLMKHVTDYFFERFGPVTIKSGDVCSGAGEAAQSLDFGRCDSNDLFDIENSKTIVIWGKNLFSSSVHLIPLIKDARRRGAKILLVDPVHHQTTALSDLFVQPKPGTDAAIAFGMSRWLFESHRTDRQAATYCDHIEGYRSLVFSKSIEAWAAVAEIEPNEVVELAKAYAAGPSAILIGWGMQRRRFGATTIRALDALATISGNVGVPGGGASFYFARRSSFDFSFANPTSAPRRIPEPLLGPGIIAATDPPIRMAFVSAANPVAMLPDSNSVATALQTREFTVVVDSFLTDTAHCADLVLPTTTMLEEEDLLGAYGHHWLAEMRRVAEPPVGVKSDYEIIQAIATRVGLAAEFSGDAASWKKRFIRLLNEKGITLDDFKNGAIRNPRADKVIFADRKFNTPSGKVNLLYELPPAMFGEYQGNRNRTVQGTSLTLAALSTAKAQGSQWSTQTQTGPAIAVVHPAAADEFCDGETVRLRSSESEMHVQLKFDEQQRKDMILLEKGGWLSAGRCANALISAELTDAGQCAVYYDTTVEIHKL